MSINDLEKGSRLEAATEAVRGTEPATGEIEAARERVWRSIAGTASAARAADDGTIRECAGFQALIPAYRAGGLAPARRELFDDHIRSCVACRRALWQANGDARPAERPAASGWRSWQRWGAIAATLVVCGVLAKLVVVDRVIGSAAGATAVVERLDGTLFRGAGSGFAPVAVGERVAALQHVRTGRAARAVLRLADGSRVEMNEHSELSLAGRRDGAAVRLEHGSVIVEAAHQSSGRHLYVNAPDCEVAVKGTVFTVSHGPKGSRVSVLAGEVWVDKGSEIAKLKPGEQTATQPNIGLVPVADEVAWSSDPKRYDAFLKELAAVSRAAMVKIANVPLRFDSKLVPMLPAGTLFCAAAPNVTGELAAAGEDLLARVQANPDLKQWLDRQRAEAPQAPDMAEVVGRFRELASLLGDELVLAGFNGEGDTRAHFVLMAETSDEAGLRAAIRDNLQRIASGTGQEVPVVVLDGSTALPVATVPALYVVVRGGFAAATDSPAEVARLAGLSAGARTEFTSTPLYAQLASCYREGATWLLAADLQRVGAAAHRGVEGESERQLADRLGFSDAQSFVVELKRIAAQAQLRASLGFAHERRGVPAWLGAPGPMGSLSYVSPSAYAAACFMVKEPRLIADELIESIRATDPAGFGKLTELEQRLGISLRDDVAASLGGELMFAVDGPLLPTTSWTVVALLENQPRFQIAVEALIGEADRVLVAEGRLGVAITSSQEGGRTLYAVTAGEGGAAELHYTFDNGYWVAAASRALLLAALRTRESGVTLLGSTEFRQALPVDREEQYSAIIYANLRSLTDTLSSVVPQAAGQAPSAGLVEIRGLLSGASTMALCLTGEPNRIVMTSTGLDIVNPGNLLASLQDLGALRAASAGRHGETVN
jgi:ferric-dicitrate binding protein FerR (iron transport regulator)